MSRPVRLSLCLLPLLLCGCFSRDVTIRLQKDGSGTLTIRTEVTPEMVEYLKGITKGDTFDRGFNEVALQEAAAQYGKDVVYDSHTIKKTDELRTYEVTYRFQDIGKIKPALDTRLPFVGQTGNKPPAGTFPVFSFHNRGNGQFTLYPPKTVKPIRLEDPNRNETKLASDAANRQREEHLSKERKQWMQFGNPFGLSGEESVIELHKALSRGMKFRLQIITETPVVSTTSPYRIGEQTLVLYMIEAERVLDDPHIAKKVEANGVTSLSWEDIAHSEKVIVDTAAYRLLEL